jgi:hypothetical protein
MKRDRDGTRHDDDLAEPLTADDTAAGKVAQDTASAIDWPSIIEEAGLDQDSIAYWAARELRGVPHAQIAQALGWYSARAERTRKRIERALRRLRVAGVRALPRPRVEEEDRPLDHGTSLRPFYIERLDSGHRLFSLSHSNHLLCPKLPISRGPISKGTPMNSNPDTRLTAARLALAPMMTAKSAAEDLVRDLAVEHETKKGAAATTPAGKLRDMIVAEALRTESKLKRAETALKAAADEVSKQEKIIQDIEDGVVLAKRKVELARLTPKFDKLKAALNEVIDSSFETISEMNAASNLGIELNQFFPYGSWEAEQIIIIREALRVRSYLLTYRTDSPFSTRQESAA